MSNDKKIREDLQTARAAAARVLGRRAPTTSAQLDECPQILDEIIRFVERRPVTATSVDAIVAAVALDGLAEVRERLKARSST